MSNDFNWKHWTWGSQNSQEFREVIRSPCKRWKKEGATLSQPSRNCDFCFTPTFQDFSEFLSMENSTWIYIGKGLLCNLVPGLGQKFCHLRWQQTFYDCTPAGRLKYSSVELGILLKWSLQRTSRLWVPIAFIFWLAWFDFSLSNAFSTNTKARASIISHAFFQNHLAHANLCQDWYLSLFDYAASGSTKCIGFCHRKIWVHILLLLFTTPGNLSR